MKKFFSLLVLCVSLPLMAQEGRVIYGTDSRVDLYDATLVQRDLASSTAALIYEESLSLDSQQLVYELQGSTFKEGYALCDSEPFGDQRNPAFCSGFLVGEDLMVTAGHCVEESDDCSSLTFAFGFDYTPGSPMNYMIPKEDIYKCREIVERVYSYDVDYAVVRLDRKTNRKPLSFRKSGVIEKNEEVFVIGHPAGLPTKVATGKVRMPELEGYFVTNLDTYGGNSGSAVFNAKTGLVEGILVRGERDFVTDEELGCYKSNVCEEDDCRGEDVTKITSVKKLMDL